MVSHKQILVTTTSTIEGKQIQRYIKPISAHIVAGTNMFSDFIASFSDVFGGRSATYQRQLKSLYNEAIERLKASAFEVGANCIVGLKIDMDEISGKGKSMFMLTAIGTAVIIENEAKQESVLNSHEKLENVDVDSINQLRTKREIINNGNSGKLTFDDDVWGFITSNGVYEAYELVIAHVKYLLKNYNDMTAAAFPDSFKKVIAYIDSLQEERRITLVYNSIEKEKDDNLVDRLLTVVKELRLLDLDKATELLTKDDFVVQKRGLKILTYDKGYYAKDDVNKLTDIITLVRDKFQERGIRSMKKQLLSSKEKEVWTCDCGKVNDIDSYCNGCEKDINGFKYRELTAAEALKSIEEKISLIKEYID